MEFEASQDDGIARVVDVAEVRRRPFPLVLEPAPFPGVVPEGDPVFPVLHERPLLAAVRLEVVGVLFPEDLTEERDPQQVAVVEGLHPVAIFREDFQHLLALERLPEVAGLVAAPVAVFRVHRVGLVEILVQKEEGARLGDFLAGCGVLADMDLVPDHDLQALRVGLSDDFDRLIALVDRHLCVLLNLSCRRASHRCRPLVGAPRPSQSAGP